MKQLNFLLTSGLLLAGILAFALGRKPTSHPREEALGDEYFLYGEPSRLDERTTSKVLYERHRIVLKRVAGCEFSETEKQQWDANNDRINRALGLKPGQDIFASIEDELLATEKNVPPGEKAPLDDPVDRTVRDPKGF